MNKRGTSKKNSFPCFFHFSQRFSIGHNHWIASFLFFFLIGTGIYSLTAQAPPQPHSLKGSSEDQLLDANQRAVVSEMQESFRRLLDKQDKELDELLKELKKAPKEKKVDCLTTIITRLIEQRKEMHQEMDAMRSRMRELKSLSQSSSLPNAFEPPAAPSSNASSNASSPPPSAQPNQDSQDNETAR
ncbi:hypothetical protein A7K73_05015 [Candidatus Methylacidiphilum fumarolicum]|uniref:hypothetical protein n=1 Tax=Candidatus Methylacidiphilum fumarolicum TaxID=591154 RepID=UPI00106C34BF|nr:hypothetical protein [Candidatus Methylacidiphilum fumarolicum]TFE69970.1 hypothetical protein A7K73_05015 [Candidatus Methylacidiphilum fumarolicum]